MQKATRPITVTDSINHIVGTDSDRIIDVAGQVLAGKKGAGRLPKFCDRQAAERIAEIVLPDLSLAEGTHAHGCAS